MKRFTGEKKTKQIYLPQKTGRDTQTDLLLTSHTLPRRRGLLDPSRRYFVRVLGRQKASLHDQGGPIATITALKAGLVNEWKFPFRQHNHSIKTSIDLFASQPKKNQVRQRKLDNRFSVTPVPVVK